MKTTLIYYFRISIWKPFSMTVLPYQILYIFAILHHRFCMCTIGLGLELKKGNWPCRQSQDKKCARPSGHLEPHMYHIIEPTFTCVRRYCTQGLWSIIRSTRISYHVTFQLVNGNHRVPTILPFLDAGRQVEIVWTSKLPPSSPLG